MRLRKWNPPELDPAQRELYEAITAGPRSDGSGGVPLVDAMGALEGPFNAFLLRPRLGRALEALGATLRFETDLPARCREIAILTVAALLQSAFEKYAHEPVAQQLGIGEDQISGIDAGDYHLLSGDEATTAYVVTELVRTGTLSDETFDAAAGAFGVAGVFELTTLVGYYRLLALQLRVFEVHTPTPESLTEASGSASED